VVNVERNCRTELDKQGAVAGGTNRQVSRIS
jgi:hypothetical protein